MPYPVRCRIYLQDGLEYAVSDYTDGQYEHVSFNFVFLRETGIDDRKLENGLKISNGGILIVNSLSVQFTLTGKCVSVTTKYCEKDDQCYEDDVYQKHCSGNTFILFLTKKIRVYFRTYSCFCQWCS